ncbi:translation initiation factor eIF-1A [Candidatus Woesearchaeota archaeon]|jgi:translation initiation factor 1A|nr:translation initiation factor eIF-1A [Candidatus Woesearchaeota archaeon]
MQKKRPRKKPFRPQIQEEVFRVKLPRGREVLGILEERVGGSRAKVRCLDGKKRICRIPGRLKRRLWIRAGDILIIEPWELGGDEKGDIIYKYRPNQVAYLKKQGHLDKLSEFQEF